MHPHLRDFKDEFKKVIRNHRAIHPFCPKSTFLFVTPAAESDGRRMSVTIHICM